MENATIKIGISACLLGERVRYNGGHQLDRFLVNTLGPFVEYVPVCPETECGLGIPRETLRLVGDIDHPRLVTTKTGIDHSDRMAAWAQKRLDLLAGEDLCGFIFKRGSPSSGLMRVKVYGKSGMPQKQGVGFFARMFVNRFPLLPVEEEGRLNDPVLRETFIEQIFTLKRWRAVLRGDRRPADLVDFHTRQKLLMMSHSLNHYRLMGKLVATAGSRREDPTIWDAYESLLLEALRLKTTVKKNINVLMHILGYFKKYLTPDEKQEMLEQIDRYRQEHVPLIVPMTLFNHFVRKYDVAYLKMQTYLNPHPIALRLRNHV